MPVNVTGLGRAGSRCEGRGDTPELLAIQRQTAQQTVASTFTIFCARMTAGSLSDLGGAGSRFQRPRRCARGSWAIQRHTTVHLGVRLNAEMDMKLMRIAGPEGLGPAAALWDTVHWAEILARARDSWGLKVLEAWNGRAANAETKTVRLLELQAIWQHKAHVSALFYGARLAGNRCNGS